MNLLLDERPEMEALWPLLCRCARSYTLGDSQSLPLEVMEELLSSICFTLRRSGFAPECFSQAQDLLWQDVERQRGCWAQMCQTLPDLESEPLHTSACAIGMFFEQYDHRHMAHEIPCLIDYPLLLPVAEDALGVDWIALYLRGLTQENRLLNAFAPKDIRPLLDRHCASWRTVPVNIAQPILANALGLMVLDEPYQTLRLDTQQLERLRGIETLDTPARCLCRQLGLDEPYFAKAAQDLLPRIRTGGLEGVFTIL